MSEHSTIVQNETKIEMKLTNMILCNKGGDFIKRNKIIRRNIQKYIHTFMEKFLKCL